MSDFDAQAALVVEKEAWAQEVAKLICNQRRHIDLETALAGARWACIWVDDFKALEGFTDIEAIDVAYESSKSRASAIARYPSGFPTLRVIASAVDAFCFSFQEEAKRVSKLIEWSRHQELTLAKRVAYNLYW